MKILKICMLSLLLALCAVIAVAVILQINRGGDNDNAADSYIGSASPGSADGIIEGGTGGGFPGYPDNFDNEHLNWPRAMVKPAGSEYWLFYPVVPEDAKPGDMVVLSASANGFVAWEADPDYADVELFGQVFDDGQVYVSFVMPDEKFAIRALFDDMYISGYSPQEQGAFMSVAAAQMNIVLMPNGDVRIDGLNRPQSPTNRINLPDGMVGMPYSQNILSDFGVFGDKEPEWRVIEGDEFAAGLKFDWTVDDPNAHINGTGLLPAGSPTTAGSFNFTIAVRPYKWVLFDEEDPDLGGEFVLDTANEIEFNFSIRIREKLSINHWALPDGMVGSDYKFSNNPVPPSAPPDPIVITAAGITEENIWEWRITAGGDLPPAFPVFGLHQFPDNTARIAFVPEIARATPYTFDVELWYTGPSEFISNPVAVSEYKFSIRIWDKPEIQEHEFPDGIIDFPYGTAVGADTDVFTDFVPSGTWKWWWVDEANKPNGLNIRTNIDSSGTVHGRSMVPDDYNFELEFFCEDNLNMGYFKRAFSIKIWDEPTWLTETDGLKEGMDWRRKYDPEPEDKLYEDFIQAELPEGMAAKGIVWEMELAGALPVGAKSDFTSTPTEPYEGVEFDWHTVKGSNLLGLKGNPQTATSKDYDFYVYMTIVDNDNVNINGKEISKPFFIRMWERRYLHIDIRGDAFVIRENEEAEVNWTRPGWDNVITTPEAMKYLDRRAVMPGDYGKIMIRLAPNFVLWEVVGTSEIPVEHRPAQNQLLAEGGIGKNWEPTGTHSFARIRMPDFVPPGKTSRVDGDIFIRGTQLNSVIRIDPPSLPQYTEEVHNDSGQLRIDANVQCSHEYSAIPCTCPNSTIMWRDVNNILANHNIRIHNPNNITATLIADPPKVQRPPGEPEVLFSVTLRGTMILEKSWPLIILPKAGPNWGDADGNGTVDLRDLLLMMLIEQGLPPPPSFVLENVDYDRNGIITSFDIGFHRRLFADPDAPREYIRP